MNTLPESQTVQSWTLKDEHITRESDYTKAVKANKETLTHENSTSDKLPQPTESNNWVVPKQEVPFFNILVSILIF
jgi:hypothetical protein